MKWAPFAAFAVFVAVAAVWLSRDSASRPGSYEAGSSMERGSEGAWLARAYLEAKGDVQLLTTPLEQAQLDPRGVLLRLDVEEKDLSSAEDAFVRGGGRLVVALRDAPQESAHALSSALRKVSPLFPGVRKLVPLAPRALPATALVDAQPLFEWEEDVSIARRRLGKGEVVWIAEPELLLNDLLPQADHLALLAALTADRPVVFDEFSHRLGGPVGAFGLLKRWGFGPALLLLALATLAGFWRRARTGGPPDAAPDGRRSEAVELVDSLAQLYRRALKPEEAVDLYRQQLVREFALTLGTTEERAAGLLPPRSDLAALVSACERFRNEHRRRKR